MGFWGFSVIPMDPNGILGFLRNPNGSQWDFGVSLGSQWIPSVFWGVSVIPMDSDGILGFLQDPSGILGFLRDPNGSQWDFGVSL